MTYPRTPFWLAMAALLTLPACGDLFEDAIEQAQQQLDDQLGDADAVTDTVTAPTRPDYPVFAGIAVAGSDYMSSSLSTLHVDGTLARENGLHSGSTAAGLSTALSGDVVLASHANANSTITVLDRFNGVLTWVERDGRTVVAQQLVGGANGVNPYDLLQVAPDKAYVARYGVVLDDDGEATDGDDLLVIDPQARSQSGTIVLTDYASSAPNTSGTTYARPVQLVAVEDLVYVLLQNQSFDFDTGPLGVLVIDPTDDAVLAHVVETAKANCGAAVYVRPASEVVISCGGSFSNGDQLGESGIVVLDVRDPADPVVARVIDAADFATEPLNGQIAVLGPGQVAVATNGISDWGTGEVVTPDHTYVVDTSATTAAATEIYATEDAYVTSLFGDPTNRRLYVGDASFASPQVVVFETVPSTGVVTETATIPFASALPPRQIVGF